MACVFDRAALFSLLSLVAMMYAGQLDRISCPLRSTEYATYYVVCIRLSLRPSLLDSLPLSFPHRISILASCSHLPVLRSSDSRACVPCEIGYMELPSHVSDRRVKIVIYIVDGQAPCRGNCRPLPTITTLSVRRQDQGHRMHE